MRKYKNEPSNSFAVPVVSAFVNDLINQGKSKNEIDLLFNNLDRYPKNEKQKSISTLIAPEREIPIIFLFDEDTKFCCNMMDRLYEKYEVQSSVLSYLPSPYDVRIKTAVNTGAIRHDLNFMKRYYKTDLVFVVGSEKHFYEIHQAVEIDVKLIRQKNSQILISYEHNHVLESDVQVPDRLHEILTMQE